MTPSFPTRRSSDLVNIYNAKWRACAVSQLAFLPAVAPTCDSVLDLTSAPVSNVRCVQALRLELLTTQGILWLLRALQCRVCQRYLVRSEEHTSELKSLMRNSYAVFCLINKK